MHKKLEEKTPEIIPLQEQLNNHVKFTPRDLPEDQDYRPISVLSVVSRLFEKLVHEQLYSYIKDSLSKTQSGFKPGHSTESSLLNTANKWIINIDKKPLI